MKVSNVPFKGTAELNSAEELQSTKVKKDL